MLKSIGDSVAADVSNRKRRIEATVFHDIAATHMEIQAIYQLSQNVGKSLNVSETMATIASKIKNIIPDGGLDTQALLCAGRPEHICRQAKAHQS